MWGEVGDYISTIADRNAAVDVKYELSGPIRVPEDQTMFSCG